MLHQPEPPSGASGELPWPTREEDILEGNDLLTHDTGEDFTPPPAYGDTYGEIRNEKDGASARVTDDGRVNIRINQVNRRLSQIFTPALRQQTQNVQDNGPPPPPYIPPSLGGKEGELPPPPMNVVIQVVGSRGDVQPFVALGKVLKETYGHRVRLATHPTFKDFVLGNGLEFFSIGGDPAHLMAFMVQNPRLMPGFRNILRGDVSQRRRDVAEYIQGCWRSCYEGGDGLGSPLGQEGRADGLGDDKNAKSATRPFVADCIIANPPSFAHIHCAEKLGIPLHIMFTMPYSPTRAFPHPLANIQSSNADPQLTNYISYAMIEVLAWQGLGDIINRFRAKCLDLDPVSLIWVPGMLERLKIPHTYCWSPSLIPKPNDWGSHISIAGFYFLNAASDYSPAPELKAFLDAGPAPIYVGFGSIVLDDPDAMTDLIFEAVNKTGQRVLLSKGWGGLGAESRHIPDRVFMLGNVPHDWLFNHVSCVVHHGGAGTTAAGIAAGRPTVIVPFFGDQPFWGAMIARAGAGPEPIPHKQLTANKLADAIDFCLKPESLDRAKELAGKITAERGSDTGAQLLHQYLEVDRLRCTLAPSRAATWRVKRTQVRLSAFAACTLVNASLLDFQSLKLFRPQEYQTDEGPWDPVSGGAAACYRAFSGMAMGVAEVPSESLKPFRTLTRSSRQVPGEAESTSAGKSELSLVGESSTTETLSGQTRLSRDSQESLARVQTPSNLATRTRSASNLEVVSLPEVTKSDSTSSLGSSSQDAVLTRDVLSSHEIQDKLRPTGAHTSKGMGRLVRTAVKAPMDISVNLTKGFHNFPKLWGDDTVRPQEQVTGFMSGARAAGKEFGYGWYDGVTGLVTQPWRGAQKEGASGFVKGFGKGIMGFATKPLAGFSGVLAYPMKGVHRGMKNLFGGHLQNYIVASRVAQGYEEWQQSTEAEKQAVIERWKLIQKHLKENRDSDEAAQYLLKTRGQTNTADGLARPSVYAAGLTQSASTEASVVELDNNMVAGGDSPSTAGSPQIAECPTTDQPSHRSIDTISNSPKPVEVENVSPIQSHERETSEHEAAQDDLHQAMSASEMEAQHHREAALEYENQLKLAMAQSLEDHRQRSDSHHVGPSNPVFEMEGDHDWGHVAGTSRREFEAQQQERRGEKTAQERTEEEIVMEYVKKQSLLEAQHRSKGKTRAPEVAEEDDEDLREAMRRSMQEV
jgi:UDP:flavonoid glycosyltransferase YjiC (YdhE family)